MRLDIKIADDEPTEEEWLETWVPFVKPPAVKVYQALRRAGNREVSLSVLASEVGVRASAIEKALGELEAVGLLKVDDEA